MNSPELLLLVENCPKGAETLVTRCLHILTDKGKKLLGQSTQNVAKRRTIARKMKSVDV